jgi:2-oxoglutarate dehydrogenase E1 component
MSPLSEFTKGNFREVIHDPYVTKSKVKRVIFCSGKIYYDLLEEQQKNKRKDIAILRIEQLFPFPEIQILDQIAAFKNPELYWVQEEPANMGYWAFLDRMAGGLSGKVRLIARKHSASPATGYSGVHASEQKEIIATAFA